jgi:hypothetical protein
MSRDAKKYTIVDDYEEPHEYFTVQHPGTEGLKLQNKLQRALVPALGSIRAESLRTLQSEAGEASDAEIMAVGMQAMQGAFAQALELLDPATIKALMRHTTRDGKKLSSDLHFDRAYQGNYGELYLACWEIAKLNFGPALQRLSGNGVLDGVKAAVRRVTGRSERPSD